MSSDKPIYIKQTREPRPNGAFSGYAIVTTVHRNEEYSVGLIVKPLYHPFVKRVSDKSFVRYANLADLNLLTHDLDVADSTGASEYRDSTFTIVLDNLAVAMDAAAVISDAVNNIVSVYLETLEKFIGDSVSYLPYPPELDTVRDKYIASYQAARDSRVSTESSQTAIQHEVDLCDQKRELLSTAKQDICGLAEGLQNCVVAIPGVLGKYRDTLSSLIDLFSAENTSHTSAMTALKTWLSQLSTSDLVLDPLPEGVSGSIPILSSLIALNTSANQLCASYTGKYNVAESQCASKLSELKNSVDTKAVAAALEQSALRDLSTYCPDLDPSTV